MIYFLIKCPPKDACIESYYVYKMLHLAARISGIWEKPETLDIGTNVAGCNDSLPPTAHQYGSLSLIIYYLCRVYSSMPQPLLHFV